MVIDPETGEPTLTEEEFNEKYGSAGGLTGEYAGQVLSGERDPIDLLQAGTIDRDSASWEQALREGAARIEQRYGLASGSLYDPTDLAGVQRNYSYARNAGRDPVEFINNQLSIYDTRGASGGSRAAGGYNTNWNDNDPRRFSGEANAPRPAGYQGQPSMGYPQGQPGGASGRMASDRSAWGGSNPRWGWNAEPGYVGGLSGMTPPQNGGVQQVGGQPGLDQLIQMLTQLVGGPGQEQAREALLRELARLGLMGSTAPAAGIPTASGGDMPTIPTGDVPTVPTGDDQWRLQNDDLLRQGRG